MNEAEKIIETIMDENKLATHAQVADFLGIAASTLHGLIVRNSVKTLKKHLRFKNLNIDSSATTLFKQSEKTNKLDQALDMFTSLVNGIKKNPKCDKNFKFFCFQKIEEIKSLILSELNQRSDTIDSGDNLNETKLALDGKLHDGTSVSIEIDETTMLDLISKLTQNKLN